MEVWLYQAKILNDWSAFCSCWLLLAFSLQGSPSASKILQTVNGFSEMQLRILHIWTQFPQLQTVFLSWPNFPRRRPNKYRYQSSKRQVHLPALTLHFSQYTFFPRRCSAGYSLLCWLQHWGKLALGKGSCSALDRCSFGGILTEEFAVNYCKIHYILYYYSLKLWPINSSENPILNGTFLIPVPYRGLNRLKTITFTAADENW